MWLLYVVNLYKYSTGNAVKSVFICSFNVSAAGLFQEYELSKTVTFCHLFPSLEVSCVNAVFHCPLWRCALSFLARHAIESTGVTRQKWQCATSQGTVENSVHARYFEWWKQVTKCDCFTKFIFLKKACGRNVERANKYRLYVVSCIVITW